MSRDLFVATYLATKPPHSVDLFLELRLCDPANTGPLGWSGQGGGAPLRVREVETPSLIVVRCFARASVAPLRHSLGLPHACTLSMAAHPSGQGFIFRRRRRRRRVGLEAVAEGGADAAGVRRRRAVGRRRRTTAAAEHCNKRLVSGWSWVGGRRRTQNRKKMVLWLQIHF